ncbi:hypothetical protein J5N97_025294 [Dioscorea zingiberensis]|uniref:Cytochrome P450 n=1 Tax=Dioscorea zingiberensis TaxID=325984 RepID=A0A9D5C812_9LILI|nr:hypothetical protein J5N97_025294 [Dioscorea zingiberensis]
MALLLVIIPLFIFNILKTKPKPNLPPGPSPWAILRDLRALTQAPQAKLADLAREHGSLFTLRLGPHLTLVASDSSSAHAVFKTCDRELSGRHVQPSFLNIKGFVEHSVVWSQPDEYWRKSRRILHAELLSQRMMKSLTLIREKKVVEMVNGLKDRESDQVLVNIGDVVFQTMLGLLCELLFSCDLCGLRMTASEFKVEIWRKKDHRLDGNLLLKRLFESWEGIISERRSSANNIDHVAACHHDFLDILLAAEFTEREINVLLMDIFIAGTDTTTTTIEWAISELMKNPKAMAKLRQELEEEVQCPKDGIMMIKESHLPHLHYLHACIKETFRLHPPVPLISRRALESCELLGYQVPKGCLVTVNAWAMGRDPKAWNDPLEFRPERFIDDGKYSSVDQYNNNYGSDFRLVPFGGGRRVCLGIGLADKMLTLILASLVHGFEWSLPPGMQPGDLQMNEIFGLTLKKDPPLLLLPKVRS